MKHLKRLPYQKEDFAWVAWTPSKMKKDLENKRQDIEAAHQAICRVPNNERTFENTPRAIAALLAMAFEDNPYAFMLNVSPKKDVRDAAEICNLTLENLYNDLKADKGLYQALTAYVEGVYKSEKAKLDSDSIKLVEDMILQFERAGLGLSPADQKTLKKLIRQAKKLELDFGKTLRSYQDFILITKQDLEELPPSLQSQLTKVGNKYKVDLSYPVVGPFLRFSSNAKLRQKLADKLAAEGGKANLRRMEKLVAIRYEIGKLMGYPSFADYQIAPKMAKDAQTVRNFTIDILEKTKPAYQKERTELEDFKKRLTGDRKAKLEYHDTAYYSRLLIKEKFDYDAEEVRQYFPLEQVLDGTFWLMKKVFGIDFKPIKLPVWHKDVFTYEVTQGKKLMGYVGFDLFPRANKYDHVCLFPVHMTQETQYGSSQTRAPFAVMIGQFPKPSKANPSLLSFSEVETFLHEFGHMMHGTLTEARHPLQSGFGVAFDFIEVPSQLFENWIENYDVVKKFSRHHQTGKALPKDLFAKVQKLLKYGNASRYNGQGIQQLFDLEIHSKKPIKDLHGFYLKLAKKYRGKVSVSPKSNFPASFGHLTSQLYVAGYYGYMWSRVYAQDCFSAFNKEGVLSRATGKKLQEEILAAGGSRSDMESLKAFLGRTPNNKAFLEWADIEK